MYNFSDILSDLIEEKGLSLRKVAIESKVSAIQYSKYLRGNYPTVDVAVRIADYFNCSLDYLFGVSDQKHIVTYKGYDLSVFLPRYQNTLMENKITHWKFAKNYGLSESTLRHWKYGETPSIPSLILIATNLSVSIDYLIGRKN